jgi:hypothetical protein
MACPDVSVAEVNFHPFKEVLLRVKVKMIPQEARLRKLFRIVKC